MAEALAAAGADLPTSYTDRQGTKFYHLLQVGAFQVVKGRYFTDGFKQRRPIQMRQDIAPEYVWDGEEAAQLWEDHGVLFLVSISYAWLDVGSPDPECFHLERLARLVDKHLESYGDILKYEGVADIGVLMDYCCFSQKKLVDGVDIRTDAEKKQLKAGLEEINTIYGHEHIMVWRLEQVPETVARKYDDRGWTLFERVIIDGKGCSKGDNIVALREGHEEDKDGLQPIRGPPLTPERFVHELEKRGERATAKNVTLFTNGKQDYPLVIRKYRDSFQQLIKATVLRFEPATHWTLEDAEALVLALPKFRKLELLQVFLVTPEVGEFLTKELTALLEAATDPLVGYLVGLSNVGDTTPPGLAELNKLAGARYAKAEELRQELQEQEEAELERKQQEQSGEVPAALALSSPEAAEPPGPAPAGPGVFGCCCTAAVPRTLPDIGPDENGVYG